jgi:predicted permease
MLRTIWQRLCAFRSPRTVKREIDEELRFHIEQRTAENIAVGMPAEQAAREARKRFGNFQTAREQCREARGSNLIEATLQDARLSFRMLRTNPGFAAVSVFSLAVGFAVNVAVFSCLNALLFRPAPGVKHPEQLVYLHEMVGGVPYEEFEYIRDHRTAFANLAASTACRRGVRVEYAPSGGSAPRRQLDFQSVRFVSGNYFSLLGIEFRLGRGFRSEEDQTPGSHPVAILSHLFWERAFNSDPAVVGQTVMLNNLAYTVVGIAPADCPREPGVFVPPAAWVPFMMPSILDPGQSMLQTKDGGLQGVQFYGRLKPGATPARAEAELTVLDAQFAKEFFAPDQPRARWADSLETGFSFLPWRPWQMKALAILTLSVSGSVLLIACANVASLLLARATSRQREIGVRLALGASRRRLVRQLLTESMIIACLGGGLGLLAGVWLGDRAWSQLVMNVLPSGLGESLDFGLDWRIIRYAVALTLATGVVFGLAPALEATKASVSSALKQENMLLGHRLSRSRLRSFLIVAQIALSLTLLIGTTLMLRRVQTGTIREYGFETRHVLMIEFSSPSRPVSAFQPLFLQRIAAIPGIRSACLAQVWYARYVGRQSFLVDGQSSRPKAGMALSKVTPQYFPTLGIPIVQGRNFTGEEAKAEAPVLIVSESFAKHFWPGRDPIGQRLKIGATNAEAVVIGLARDGVREIRSQYELQPYAGDFYAPLSPATSERSEVWVRTDGNPFALMPLLRQEMGSLDETLGFGGRRLSDLAATWVRPMLVLAMVVGILGALALLLASVGIYGVVAYVVAQRTQEITIRVALGAQRRGILGLMLWQGMRLVAFGMAAGLLGSVCLSFVLRNYFYGLSPADPVTFLGVSAVLSTAALLACYIPARRATKIDPMVALRYE